MYIFSIIYVAFQVLMVVGRKMTAFWDIVLCNLVGVGQRFRGAYCLHHQGDDHHDDERSMHL
jgi:hypothetical protein